MAILATATLFALAHGAQNLPLFFDRFAFGLIAGWLVTRTGGLEAGIALHILNNFLAFGLALAFGDLTATLKVSSVSWWNIPLTDHPVGVFLVLVLLVARRWGCRTAPRPPVGRSRRRRLRTRHRHRLSSRVRWASEAFWWQRRPTCILMRASQGAAPWGMG